MCALRFLHLLDNLTKDAKISGGGHGDRPQLFLKPVRLNGSRKQLALNCCDLLLDHAVEVQFITAGQG